MTIDSALIQDLCETAKKSTVNTAEPAKIISLVDLTSLNDSDDEQTIEMLCLHATTPLGRVAAICIYPQFIPIAKVLLAESSIKIATVINFPNGSDTPDTIKPQVEQAITAGADEIDFVFPYKDYLTGNPQKAVDMIKLAKSLCGSNILLKVILETGVLETNEHIKEASNIAIFAGADFIKTSTGKTPIGATLEAAAVMLLSIKEAKGINVGFKASGGIKTPKQAISYLTLAESILGKSWVSPKTFRFGASSLVNSLL